jgi:hypothetical protein
VNIGNPVPDKPPARIHELTPRQYREAYLKGMQTEYGITRKEAEEGHCVDFEISHYQACVKAAASGIELRRQVLDALSPGLRRSILHDFPTLHRNYMLPEARKMNKERERRLRQNRKRTMARSFGYSCWQQNHGCDETIDAPTQREADIKAHDAGWVLGHHDGQAHYSCANCKASLHGVYGPIPPHGDDR